MMFELYLQNLFLFQIPDDNQLFVLFNSSIKILKHLLGTIWSKDAEALMVISMD